MTRFRTPPSKLARRDVRVDPGQSHGNAIDLRPATTQQRVIHSSFKRRQPVTAQHGKAPGAVIEPLVFVAVGNAETRTGGRLLHHLEVDTAAIVVLDGGEECIVGGVPRAVRAAVNRPAGGLHAGEGIEFRQCRFHAARLGRSRRPIRGAGAVGHQVVRAARALTRRWPSRRPFALGPFVRSRRRQNRRG